MITTIDRIDDIEAAGPVRNEIGFRAMGTTCHVLVEGPIGLAESARRRVEQLEQRWSRFRPDSELSRLNARAGMPTVVSADTFLLLQRAVEAWERTGGAFDPTVLDAVRAAGYDRDLASLDRRRVATDDVDGAAPLPSRPSPGCAGIVLDARTDTVTLPLGVAIDAGGIGKGLAADLVSAELMEAGATAVLVNLGGDLRVRGAGPDDGMWPISVEDPFDRERSAAHLSIGEGAFATSSRQLRTWWHDGRAAHHLIDPRTGRPAVGGPVAVSVIAGEAWWAEVAAKALMIEGRSAHDALDGSAAVVFAPDGSVSVGDALADSWDDAVAAARTEAAHMEAAHTEVLG